MHRFLKWLGTKLFPKEPEPKLRHTGIRLKPKPARKRVTDDYANGSGDVSFDPEVYGRIEDGGPGKNVLVRNKYVREDSGTHDNLKIINESLIDSGEEEEFDPYNTGRFDKSKHWNARTIK